MMHKSSLTFTAFVGLLSFGVQGQVNAAGVLDKIKDTKTITIGYRESSVPFSYIGNDQQPIGYTIDLCKHVVNALAKSVAQPSLNVKYIPVNSANRIPLLKNGTIDMECGGTSSSVERLKQVSFSVATFASRPRWLVKTSEGIKSVDDLKGKNIVVTQGSNAVPLAVEINKKDNQSLRIQQAKDHAESMMMLSQGRASAFLEDDILLAAKKADAPNPSDYTILAGGYTVTYYGIMLPKDDAPFKKVVDDELSNLMASGEFETIYKKWFESAIPPNNINLNVPMGEQLRARVAHPSDEVQ
ncbi:amino acid ABC transporter substrate-binding protein [Brenneria roseae subsp. roseae]|uniref:amino acid ABC transporter substrate-binding protein n=1 Tax=Brenneria roseae TaxID=1509241 RepID=UPI000D61DC58|nr:amino acid ABC transporter substrate-binding protein [Brenneria roseae]PWC22753.1 amino acid ABC transporter substrate-binding protein [Brenneria roseae subsp. roseae]